MFVSDTTWGKDGRVFRSDNVKQLFFTVDDGRWQVGDSFISGEASASAKRTCRNFSNDDDPSAFLLPPSFPPHPHFHIINSPGIHA